MCAAQAGFLGRRVVVLEKNNRPGAKILISGGGRCNYTNVYSSPENFQSENAHFLHSAFSQWTVADTIGFFETYGIAGQEKTLGQLFPVSNKAADIVAVFTSLCADFGQEIVCNAEVTAVCATAGGYSVTYLENGAEKTVGAPKVVVAAGGLPIRKLGATDFGLKLGRQVGHRIVPTAPALVPLTITGKEADWFGMLSGNAFHCRVWNKRISFTENVLFTHWGLSGPAILQLSSYWRPGEELFIDFLPDRQILNLVKEQKRIAGKKQLSTVLAGLFSRRFAEALENFLPTAKNIADLNAADLDQLERLVHAFRVLPAGDKGYDKAEVMRGGVSTDELSSRTLESRKSPGLYFGGECVDVTGWLGGYNFQWAWASGFVIAQQL